MQGALAAAARGRALPDDAASLADRAYVVAMEPRVRVLDDDHHPAFLHPGRCMLILLHDVGAVEAEALAVGALHESTDAELRASDSCIESLGETIAQGVLSLPYPGDERLAERLVGLPESMALAVLAERLDHVRHLHLREELRDRWREVHSEARDVWLPFAQRVHVKLGVRYAHWIRTFGRRL